MGSAMSSPSRQPSSFAGVLLVLVAVTLATLAALTGQPFQSNFYWNTPLRRVDYGRGFKVKFNRQFSP